MFFIKSRDDFQWPQCPKLDFWGAKLFSEFVSPSVPLGPACGAWAMGPRLPRQHTAARRSRGWPRVDPRAAHRGQGGRGCGGERPRPRPRTRIWGGKTLLRQWDFYARKWMACWWFKFFEMLHYFVESVLPKFLALIFCVVFCVFDDTVPTPWFFKFLWNVCRNICSNTWCFLLRPCCLHWRFWFGSFLERPSQSKIDRTFPAQFNGPWHPGFYQFYSVTCVCTGSFDDLVVVVSHTVVLPIKCKAISGWMKFESKSTWSKSDLVSKDAVRITQEENIPPFFTCFSVDNWSKFLRSALLSSQVFQKFKTESTEICSS